jgi:hypothetical protein
LRAIPEFHGLHPALFQAFKEDMGFLRRMLGGLVGRSAPKAEDIIFEPIDGPGARPAVALEVPLEVVRGSAHSLTLGDLMARVPAPWRRSGEWVPEQMITLQAAGRLNAGAERPLAYSLRYLVKCYPDFFRDPGVKERDIGVDLAMEPLREPEPALTEVPAEVLDEAQIESETFTHWEGETQTKRARSREARETAKALRSVELPASKNDDSSAFAELLVFEEPSPKPESQAAARESTVPSPGIPASGRLKKILEAYASGIVPSAQASVRQISPTLRILETEKVGFVPPEKTAEAAEAVPSSANLLSSDVPQKARAGRAPGEMSPGPPALQQMRFEELGLSLSRFPEVRGFALWLGDDAMQTGELGVDTKAATTRFRLEKILESASLTHGAQDGFLSVTVNHARGGVSVFGGGPCLVVVAHQSEGMPSHLRSWLCGWVSQPLRG